MHMPKLKIHFLCAFLFCLSPSLIASQDDQDSYISRALQWCQKRLDYITSKGDLSGSPKHIVYVSGNVPKQREVTNLLKSEGNGIDISFVSYPDLPTLEQGTLEQVATFRAKEAFKRYNQNLPANAEKTPILIDELSLVIKDETNAGRLPGRHFKFFLYELGADKFAQLNQDKPVEIETAVAYTRDGEHVEVFHGHISGKITYPLRWGDAIPQIDASGYDPFVIPDGMANTVAEMFDEREFISPRRFQFLQLRSQIFGKIFKGVYEIHVTVKPPIQSNSESDADFGERKKEHEKQFRNACQELKQGVIVVNNLVRKKLPNGDYKEELQYQLQTKVYKSFQTGAEAIHYALTLGKELKEKGFPPIRHRTEAMFFNIDAPETDAEAKDNNLDNYFELHLRVNNSKGGYLNREEKQALIKLSEEHGMLISMVGDKFFINKKYYLRGRVYVKRHWEDFVNKVEAMGFTTKKIPWEYCMFDDKKALDAAWVSQKN